MKKAILSVTVRNSVSYARDYNFFFEDRVSLILCNFFNFMKLRVYSTKICTLLHRES